MPSESHPPAWFDRKWGRVAEIFFLFLTAWLIISIGWSLVGNGLLARQWVVWVANIAMLLVVWLGLRRRGQTWADLGLGVEFRGWLPLVADILKSIVVFIVAIVAFVVGSIFAPVAGNAPQQADMSSYAWLQGNLPMLLLALAAVYVVSSFGEEVIYRGFLINRLAELGDRSRLAYVLAAIASAVIFGLIHFDWGIVGIIQTTFMGAALAICYLVLKRRLWILVLAHGYLDTLLLVQIYLTPSPAAAS